MARVKATTAGSPSRMAAKERDRADELLVEVVSAYQPEHEEDDDDNAGDEGEGPAQAVGLALQRGRLRLGLMQHVGDPACLGCHPGGSDQGLGVPAGSRAVHEDRSDSVPERGPLVYLGGGGLADRFIGRVRRTTRRVCRRGQPPVAAARSGPGPWPTPR